MCKYHRIRVDSHYSALCIYRAYKPYFGSKIAYWLAVCQCGYNGQRDIALSKLPVNLRAYA